LDRVTFLTPSPHTPIALENKEPAMN